MNDLVKVDLEKFSSKSFLARFASGQLANLRKCFARVSEMIVIDSAKNIKCNECERATRLFPDGHTLDFHIWLNLCVLCEAFANTYCYLLRPACRASPGIWPSVQVCQGLAGQLEEAGDRGGGREGGSGSCLQCNRYLKPCVIVLDTLWYLKVALSDHCFKKMNKILYLQEIFWKN